MTFKSRLITWYITKELKKMAKDNAILKYLDGKVKPLAEVTLDTQKNYFGESQ